MTFLTIMLALVLVGVALTVAGKQWKLIVKRDQEAELLFRGNRIKAALEAYAADYEVMKTRRANRYPLSLEQLTQKNPKRYLPVVYKDPMTGGDFEPIKVGAEIQGVRSRSKERPLNQVQFKNAASYRDVTFQAAGAGAQSVAPIPNPLNPLLSQPPPPAGPPVVPPAPTP
jgi:type II secretory pathway pseudopilin PulG